MKRSRFSEEQIAYALRLAESGTPVVDVCRQIGVSEATYYTWKKKFGDLGVTELKRLKMLEDENARLKRIVADLTLDKQILQEVVRKKRSFALVSSASVQRIRCTFPNRTGALEIRPCSHRGTCHCATHRGAVHLAPAPAGQPSGCLPSGVAVHPVG